jgi:hypothetical protein
MTALEVATAQGQFTSLEAIRAAHAELLEQLPDEGLTAEEVGQIKVFLKKCAAAGTLLDSTADRKEAQSLLDYWRATLYAESREKGSNQAASELGSQRLADAVLAAFDQETVGKAAIAADQWLATLPEEDRKVVRRVMLRLARLAHDKHTFEPVPTSRAALHDVDPSSAKVDDVIARLAAAGVVRVTKGDSPEADQVAVRANELITQWQAYAEWLRSRVKFREVVEAWDRSRQTDEGLLEGDDLQEVRTYHDRNSLERKFIERSWYRERRESERDRILKWVFGGVAAFALACLLAVVWFYTEARAAEENKDYVQDSNQRALLARAISDRAYTFALIHLLTREKVEYSFHVAKKLLIIQTLAQLVTADKESWEDVKANWEKLEEDLYKDRLFDSWFKKRFFPHEIEVRSADGQRTEKRTIQEEINVFTKSRESARNNKHNLPEIGKFLSGYIYSDVQGMPDIKKRWYEQAMQCAAELMSAANDDKTLTEVSGFRNLFWRLYLGEMVLVESDDVAAEMVQFGRLLTAWESAGGTASKDLRSGMMVAVKALKEACEADLKTPR